MLVFLLAIALPFPADEEPLFELVALVDPDDPPGSPAVPPPEEDDEALIRDEVFVLYELAFPPEGEEESTPGSGKLMDWIEVINLH